MTRRLRIIRAAPLVVAALLGFGPGAPFRPPTAGAATLFGLVDSGEMYASIDAGVTWSVRSLLPIHDAVALRAGSTSSRLYLLAATGDVYRSYDAGENWSATGALTVPDAVDITFRADGDMLILTATGWIYRSSDDGAVFSALATLTGSNYVSLHGRYDGTLFALTATGEIEVSRDLGVTWTLQGTFPVPDAVACRNIGGDLYVITGTGTLWKSDDDGVHWIAISVTNQLNIMGLTTDESALIGGTREGHIYRSMSGTAWTAVGSINQLTLTALANDTPAIGAVPEPGVAGRLRLAPPSPNPWPGSGELSLFFQHSGEDRISAQLYDASGRIVARRAAERLSGSDGSGSRLTWNPGPLAHGVYFVRLTTEGGEGAARKLTVR